MREPDNLSPMNITNYLRLSLKRVGKTQAEAAALMGIYPQVMSNIILMKRGFPLTPKFVEAWCTKVEPRQDNEVRRALSYLGAYAQGWQLS
jgi:hypothetical protein